MVEIPVTRDLVILGGSAGALSALQTILRQLPHDFGAAVLVVVHQAQNVSIHLPDLLSRSSSLSVSAAPDGELMALGRVYLAPPDFHLLVERGRLRLSRGPKENRFRPAIDPLFRTAARAYGPQVVAVLLSGMLDDGTWGIIRVKQFGGVTIAQDPADAEAPGMPSSAIRSGQCDQVLKADEIAGTLVRLVQQANLLPLHGGAHPNPAKRCPKRLRLPARCVTAPTAAITR